MLLTEEHGDGSNHDSNHPHDSHDHGSASILSKGDMGIHVTQLSLCANLGMAIAKVAGGYLFHSQALVADGIHSGTDLASDILTLSAIACSSRLATCRFPLGFGKIESLGSLAVSGMLLVGGIWMAYGSILSLHSYSASSFGAAEDIAVLGSSERPKHIQDQENVAPSLQALLVAVGTIAVKEWLYQATMKVARERDSSVLASNAVHHRADSLAGLVTLALILGAKFMENATWLDPIGSLAISLLVVRTGAENTFSSLLELADSSIDNGARKSIAYEVRKALSGFPRCQTVELRALAGVKSGQNHLVSMDIAVPSAWPVTSTYDLENELRAYINAKLRGVRVVGVRFSPSEAKTA